MDKLGVGSNVIELKQKVANVRRQCKEYDALLKNFRIQYIELPLHMQKDLDDHAQFKRKFGLYAMDLAFLSAFQCTSMEQTIEKQVLILRTKRRLKQLEKEASKTKNDLIVTKNFIRNMHNDFKHVNDVDRVLRDRNREIEIFVEKKVKLEENIKIDLDRILMKLDQLDE